MARITITIDTEDTIGFDAEYSVRRAIEDIDWDDALQGYFTNLSIEDGSEEAQLAGFAAILDDPDIAHEIALARSMGA